MEKKRYTLPRAKIIKRRSDFQNVYQNGAVVPGRGMILYVLRDPRVAGKVGFAAGKKLGCARTSGSSSSGARGSPHAKCRMRPQSCAALRAAQRSLERGALRPARGSTDEAAAPSSDSFLPQRHLPAYAAALPLLSDLLGLRGGGDRTLRRLARRVDGAQAHSALSSVSSGRLRSRTVMLSSDLARTHKQAAFRVEYFVKLPKY